MSEDIPPGTDAATRAAKLVWQWRAKGHPVPVDAAYLIAKEIREYAKDRDKELEKSKLIISELMKPS